MWLSSGSRFSAPVKQQGFKQPFNQRCPLLCEASNTLPAHSLGDKHRVIDAVGGRTFTKTDKKVPQTLFAHFVFKLPQTRHSWFVHRRSKLCRCNVARSSEGKSRLHTDQGEAEVMMCSNSIQQLQDGPHGNDYDPVAGIVVQLHGLIAGGKENCTEDLVCCEVSSRI